MRTMCSLVEVLYFLQSLLEKEEGFYNYKSLSGPTEGITIKTLSVLLLVLTIAKRVNACDLHQFTLAPWDH